MLGWCPVGCHAHICLMCTCSVFSHTYSSSRVTLSCSQARAQSFTCALVRAVTLTFALAQAHLPVLAHACVPAHLLRPLKLKLWHTHCLHFQAYALAHSCTHPPPPLTHALAHLRVHTHCLHSHMYSCTLMCTLTTPTHILFHTHTQCLHSHTHTLAHSRTCGCTLTASTHAYILAHSRAHPPPPLSPTYSQPHSCLHTQDGTCSLLSLMSALTYTHTLLPHISCTLTLARTHAYGRACSNAQSHPDARRAAAGPARCPHARQREGPHMRPWDSSGGSGVPACRGPPALPPLTPCLSLRLSWT